MTRFVEDSEGSYWNLDFVKRFEIVETIFDEEYLIRFLVAEEFNYLGGGPYKTEKDADNYLRFLLTSNCKILSGFTEEKE